MSHFLKLIVLVFIFALNAQEEEIDATKVDVSKSPEAVKSPDAEKTPEKKEEDTPKAFEYPKEPPKIGNFSLPASQQPSALFGFGGNIIEKGEIQFYLFGDDFFGHHRKTTDLIPSILFGITDTWSIYFNVPFTPIMKDGRNKSAGFEDAFIQLEYAFYNNSTATYQDQATIVTNITYPTGSAKKNPATGFGAPSFFLGATYYRTFVEWVFFTSHGGILTSSEHRTKFGDQFLYQVGVAKYLASPKDIIYAWMCEVDGQYSKKNQVHGRIDPNSGGNVLYLTPSIWVSSKYYIFQLGVSVALNQNLFGHQRKFDGAVNFNYSYTYY